LGTSGQKIVLNGFAIGAGETHTSIEIHDTRDAEALVRVLRDEVVPSYYQHDRDGLPRSWIAREPRLSRRGSRASHGRAWIGGTFRYYGGGTPRRGTRS